MMCHHLQCPANIDPTQSSWLNARPPSAMSGQHWSNTVKLAQWWTTVCNVRPTLIQHRQIGSMLGHRLQCPANIDPTQSNWFNSGPPSAMSGQHWSNTGKLVQCWATVGNVHPTLIQHSQVGSILDHHLQCPSNIDPTQAGWLNAESLSAH